MQYVVFFTMFFYVSFHLLTKNYLTNDIRFLKPINYIAVFILGLSGLFKILHLFGAETLLIVGVSLTSFTLFLKGIIKGIDR
jgi:ABC-type antimicrobial peptide transport system permease subunit